MVAHAAVDPWRYGPGQGEGPSEGGGRRVSVYDLDGECVLMTVAAKGERGSCDETRMTTPAFGC